MTEAERRTIAAGRLRKARELSGLTQKEVSELCGETKSAVSKWERGIYSPPLVAVAKLADIYQRSIPWLLALEYGADCKG